MPVLSRPTRRRTGPEALRWPRSYRPPFTLSRGTCYLQAVIADSPVAFWRLEELAGFPADGIGTNPVTVTTGTPTRGVPGPLLSGDPSYATTFPAGTNFTVPDAPAIDVGDVFSIEFWLKRSAGVPGSGNLCGVINKGATGGNAYEVFIGGSDFLTLFNAGVGNVAFCDTQILNTDWHYAAVEKEAATIHWYLDGVQIADDIVTTPTYGNSTDVLVIGGETTSTNSFLGSLKDVALYNYRLGPTRVATHYAARSLACTMPIWYPAFAGGTFYEEPTDLLIEA
jgi:hypothetical protein